MKIKNPTPACIKTVTVIDEGYARTCLSDTCTCASHDGGYNWIEIPDEQASLVHEVRPSYAGSHSFTRSRFEHDILVQKALREEALNKKIAQKAWIEQKKKDLAEAYGENWVDNLWKRKITFITEKAVVSAVKLLIGEKRKIHSACVDIRSISKLRKEHFPELTGPRFESALQVADIFLLLTK